MLNLNKEVYAGSIIFKEHIGKQVPGTHFVLACDDNYRDKNGNFHTHTNVIHFVAWRYLSKRLDNYDVGDNIYVESHTVTNHYTNQNNQTRENNKHVVTKVNLIQHSRKNRAKHATNNPNNIPRKTNQSQKSGQSNSMFFNKHINTSIPKNKPKTNGNKKIDISDDELPF